MAGSPGIISEEGTYVFVDHFGEMLYDDVSWGVPALARENGHPYLCSDSTNAGLAALNLSQLPNESAWDSDPCRFVAGFVYDAPIHPEMIC